MKLVSNFVEVVVLWFSPSLHSLTMYEGGGTWSHSENCMDDIQYGTYSLGVRKLIDIIVLCAPSSWISLLTQSFSYKP